MSVLVWLLFVALLTLHQLDVVGNNPTLVGGVLPLPLVYHGGLCVAASVVWWLATKHAWPADAEISAPACPICGEEFAVGQSVCRTCGTGDRSVSATEGAAT